MKMSFVLPSSSGTRFAAFDSKTTKRPLEEMEGTELGPSGCGKVALEGSETDTRTVALLSTSRRKMSLVAPLSGPKTEASGIRLVAMETNAMKFPSSEMQGAELSPLPLASVSAREDFEMRIVGKSSAGSFHSRR